MDKQIHTGDARISYYDLDMHGSLKLSALMRMIHIAADINATELGVGFTELGKHDMTFILQRIGFRFFGHPVYNQNVKVSTWPSEVSRGTFLRQGSMHGESGEKIVEWASLWFLFDIRERKILRPNALPVNLPTKTDKGVLIQPKKIVLPDDLGEPLSGYTHEVRYADTDTNLHMNNSIYGDVIGNALQPMYGEKPIKYSEVQINYLSEARYGAQIQVAGWDVDGCVYVQGLVGGRVGFLACLM